MAKETMLQYFEWHQRADGWHWNRLKKDAVHLKKIGYSQVWMPPAYKGAAGKKDVGYSVYDLYDLGEFHQKGSISTKYGTLFQYKKAVEALHKKSIKVISDIVFNQRLGADETEITQAVSVDPHNRMQIVKGLHEVEVWTHFYFPGRRNKYSAFEWNWTCFSGTDTDCKDPDSKLLLFKGKKWDENVADEEGNFDYVLGADVDLSVDWVKKELYDWGRWFLDISRSDGFRLDCVKSIDFNFFPGWINEMKRCSGKDLFAVGEYWSGDANALTRYLDKTGNCMKLFDVPLHFHLYDASKANGNYDIRKLYDYTLTGERPDQAVAFVDNHDTQPGQALESWIDDWFRLQAYAAILLNRNQNPCVFYGDYKGIPHNKKKAVPHLNELVWIRSHLLSDNIVDYYDEDPQKACWLAKDEEHPIVVLYTIADWKERWIWDNELAGYHFVDITDLNNHVIMDASGNGRFTCKGGGCSIYILEQDYKRMEEELK